MLQDVNKQAGVHFIRLHIHHKQGELYDNWIFHKNVSERDSPVHVLITSNFTVSAVFSLLRSVV